MTPQVQRNRLIPSGEGEAPVRSVEHSARVKVRWFSSTVSARFRPWLVALIATAFVFEIAAIVVRSSSPQVSWRLLSAGVLAAGFALTVTGLDRASRETGRSIRGFRILTFAGIVCAGIGAAAGVSSAHGTTLLDAACVTSLPLFAIGLQQLRPPSSAAGDLWLLRLDALAVAVSISYACLVLMNIHTVEGSHMDVDSVVDAAIAGITVAAVVYAFGGQWTWGGLPLLQLCLLLPISLAAISALVVVERRTSNHLAENVPAPWVGVFFVIALSLAAVLAAGPNLQHESAVTNRLREWLSLVVPGVPLILGMFIVGISVWRHWSVDNSGWVLGALLGLVLMASAWQRIELIKIRRRVVRTTGQSELTEVTRAAWFAALTKDSTEAVFLLNSIGEVTFQTEVARSIFAPPVSGVPEFGAANAAFRALDAAMLEALAIPGSSVEAYFRVANDVEEREFNALVAALDSKVGLSGFVITLRDITRISQLTEELVVQGHLDELTGLANRSGFLMAVQAEIATGAKREVCVLNAFVTGYDDVLHTRGLAQADLMLRILADSLRQLASDTHGILEIGRTRSDELLIAVVGDPLVGLSDVAAITGTLDERWRGVFVESGLPSVRPAYFGYAVSDQVGRVADDLLACASLAATHAMHSEASGPIRYLPELRNLEAQRMFAEGEFLEALKLDQLVVFGEPVLSLTDREMIGAEGLIRWVHPDRGVLRPAEFLGIAARLGLLDEVGRIVLRQVCEWLAQREAEGALPAGFRMSVNIAQESFGPDLVPAISRELDRAGARAERLTIEVLESSLAHDVPAAALAVSMLRELGVHVSLDDFGTGYSSLNLLAAIPVNTVKIDGSFIADLVTDVQKQLVVRAIVNLAHVMKMNALAEGVETEEQAQLLVSMGCEWAQGYHFARAMPLPELAVLLTQGTPTPAIM